MTVQEAANTVIHRLTQAGYQAYIVGGCVRDLYLHRTPKDYDVATDARPEDVMRQFSKTLQVGAKFGVVVVKMESHSIEVATFRADGVYEDGRRPSTVEYSGSLKEDVARRDFTINGLACDTADLTFQESSHIIDLVDGLTDLRYGIIRTIGDPVQRFNEDALRMLRAVRFAVQLGFQIETGTYLAILDMASTVTVISRERIREELVKILLSPDPDEGISLLLRTGLLRHILPQVFEAGIGTLAIVLNLLNKIKEVPDRDPSLMLGILLSELAPLEFLETVKSLKLSSADVQVILAMRHWKELLKIAQPSVSKAEMKRTIRAPFFQETFTLLKLHCEVDGNMNQLNRVHAQVAAMFREGLHPEVFLNGNDLLELGLPLGPEIGITLRLLEDAQLNGIVTTREEALMWIQRLKAGLTEECYGRQA